jgi:hypothetical protein
MLKRKIFLYISLTIFGFLGFSQTSMAATYTVTDWRDNGSDASPIVNSLRWAIAQANNNAGLDTVNISVSNSITVLARLPITDSIIVDGQGATVGANGNNLFDFSAISHNTLSGNVFKNLAIINSGDGIYFFNVINSRVIGCAIGTNWANATGKGNSVGVFSVLGSGNTIGGPNSNERNIISGNNTGIYAQTNDSSMAIYNNYIGTNSSGTSALGNAYGVKIHSAEVVGGNRYQNEGNLISGNNIGIYVNGESDSICGNIIGLNEDQTAAIPNATGIECETPCSSLNIGMPIDGYGNIIAGNASYGIFVTMSYSIIVRNNFIGISANNTSFSNNIGIFLKNSSENIIGGYRNPERFERNIISGNNTFAGILIAQSSQNNKISGNYIGTDSSGTIAKGNLVGISVDVSTGDVTGNIIGGPNLDANNLKGNLISGQSSYGILISGLDAATQCSGNSIMGNSIGINANGDTALPNNLGVYLSASSQTFIGDANPTYRNVISGNVQEGIKIDDGVSHRSQGGHSIINNYIGTNTSGSALIKNTGPAAITINNTYGSFIGGKNGAIGNVICGVNCGISLLSASAFGNTIAGNWFGVLPNSTKPPENFKTGICLSSGANGNFIGQQSGAGNLIYGSFTGVSLTGNTTIHNGFYANTICAFSYYGDGIRLDLAGANESKAAPVITYADQRGVSGTAVSGNYIELYKSDRDTAYIGGSVSLVGSAVTGAAGIWSINPIGLQVGDFICGIATDNKNNSSMFSKNFLVQPGAAPVTALVLPNHGMPGKTITVNLQGINYFAPISVRLTRNGYSDKVDAFNNILSGNNLLHSSFDFTNAVPGVYNMQVTSYPVSETSPCAFFILAPTAQPSQWSMFDVGLTDTPQIFGSFAGIAIGDGDNSGLQKIFTAGRTQKITKYQKFGSAWSSVSLPQGAAGEFYSGVLVCDANRDGKNEVYAASLNNHLYQFTAPSWNKVDMGQGTDKLFQLAAGDGSNDGLLKIYTACADGHIYQFKNNGSTWGKVDVGSGASMMYAVATGDGDSDGNDEVYGGNSDHNLYQYKYNGTTWTATTIGSGGGEMYTAIVADGNHDGGQEVYGGNEDGSVYQFKWAISGWSKSIVGSGGGKINQIVFSDAENSGEDALYAACEDGHVYEFKCIGGQWVKTDLGNAAVPLYRLAIGDGDNDNQFEIYALGQNNHVYQFKVLPQSIPTPTAIISAALTPQNYFKILHSQINPNHGEKAVIKWAQPQDGPVTIKIFNLLGYNVITLLNHENYSAGQFHEINWQGGTQEGKIAGSGIYIVLLESTGYTAKAKVAVVK